MISSYSKGSPMLARYLEMNGIIGVSVWAEWTWGPRGGSRRTYRICGQTGESTGFPYEGQRNTRRAAVEHARAMADRAGLPYLGVQYWG